MAYDGALEARIDGLTGDWQPAKKRMFGGLAYFESEKMCFAIRGDELMVRAAPDTALRLLQLPGVRHATMGDRMMSNWLQASAEALENDSDLQAFMQIGRNYVLDNSDKK